MVGVDGADGGYTCDASCGADWFAQPMEHLLAVLWRPGAGQPTVLRADDCCDWVRRVASVSVAGSYGAMKISMCRAYCTDAGGSADEAALAAISLLLRQPRSCRRLSSLSPLAKCCWGRAVYRWLLCGIL